jgi:hypothetical protein
MSIWGDDLDKQAQAVEAAMQLEKIPDPDAVMADHAIHHPRSCKVNDRSGMGHCLPYRLAAALIEAQAERNAVLSLADHADSLPGPGYVTTSALRAALGAP